MMTDDEVLQKIGDCPEFSECPKCGYIMEDIDKFCKNCGKENSKFNELAFQYEWGGTSFLIRNRECGSGHNEFLSEAPEAIDLFCEFCGEKMKSN